MLYKAIMNDQKEYLIEEEDLNGLDIVSKGADQFHLLVGGKGHLIRLVEVDYLARTFVYEVDGHPLRIQLKTPLEVQIDDMGYETGAALADSEIKAPMPGLVLDIRVQEGGHVSKGDPLIILEAMKMENVIIAAQDAVIEKIFVQKGTSVEKAQLLLKLSGD